MSPRRSRKSWRDLPVNKEQFREFLGQPSLTIVEAMEKIDKNAGGILFIEAEDGRLAGCITDGDIRRWIMKGGALSAPVAQAMNRNPKTLFLGERSRANSLMQSGGIRALPLLDQAGKVADIVFLCHGETPDDAAPKKDLSDTPVVIMAGGKGTRLYPYTKILPKPLIPIGDTPIMERILNTFVAYGIDAFYMTVNYKKGMIKSYFSDLQPAYTIHYVEEDRPLGTGGSIKLIEEKFDKPIFVANCDSLIRADYSDIYAYHVQSGNRITMVCALKNMTVPYGVVHSGENGVVCSMEEKPKLSYFINTGMYVIDPETIESIPDSTMFHMTDLVETMLQNGEKVGMYPVSEDSFLDMGEFSEMKRMEEKLKIVSE